MKRLALFLTCIGICLGAASRAVWAQNGSQPTKLSGKIPAEAEVAIFPASDANPKKVTADILRSDYAAAVSNFTVGFARMQEGQKLAHYELPRHSPPFWFVARDTNSGSVYQGIWNSQSEVVQMERADNLFASLEGMFGKKAREAAANNQRLAAEVPVTVIEPVRTKSLPANSGDITPTVSPATMTGNIDPSVLRTEIQTVRSDPLTRISTEKRGLIASILHGLANVLYALCCLILICTGPLMYYLARQQRDQLSKGIELLMGRIGEARQEITALRREVTALRRTAQTETSPDRGQDGEPAVAPAAASLRQKPQPRLAGGPSFAASTKSPVRPATPRAPEQTADALAEAFVNWCTLSHNAAAHELTAFVRFLQEQRFGPVQASSVFRDRNAGSDSLTFTTSSRHAQDATEYWLLYSLDGLLLFPRPDFEEFCELYPAFESSGSIVPERLRTILPGTLVSGDGGTYQLRERGRVV